MSKQIILASASPRRFKILKSCGFKFKVIPSNIDENIESKRPESIVKELALKKAVSVAENLTDGLIIGADTIVVLNNEIIGKPQNQQDAHKILDKLNGSFHKVYSGIAVVDAKTLKREVIHEVSRVKMRRLSQDRLKVLAGKHLDKAGAYAVQEKDDAFVESIEGDYFNVVGLPIKKLLKLLKRFNCKLPKGCC